MKDDDVLPLLLQTSLSGNQDQVPSGIKSKMLAGKMKAFVIKYFWEGQKLTEKQTKALENLDPDASFAERLMVKHRRLVRFPSVAAKLVGQVNRWYVLFEN